MTTFVKALRCLCIGLAFAGLLGRSGGLAHAQSKRPFTIVGLALNIIEFLGILLIMFIGLSMKHA